MLLHRGFPLKWKAFFQLQIKLEEIVSSISKTQGWVPFGVDDPDMKKFSIVLDVIKTITFDEKYNKLDVYAVSLRIEK